MYVTKYVPSAQEGVVGIVTGRTPGGEAYRVDIGSAHQAQLDGLAFEGATKRNRPILKVCIPFPESYFTKGDSSGWLSCVRSCLTREQGHGS